MEIFPNPRDLCPRGLEVQRIGSTSHFFAVVVPSFVLANSRALVFASVEISVSVLSISWSLGLDVAIGLTFFHPVPTLTTQPNGLFGQSRSASSTTSWIGLLAR